MNLRLPLKPLQPAATPGRKAATRILQVHSCRLRLRAFFAADQSRSDWRAAASGGGGPQLLTSRACPRRLCPEFEYSPERAVPVCCNFIFNSAFAVSTKPQKPAAAPWRRAAPLKSQAPRSAAGLPRAGIGPSGPSGPQLRPAKARHSLTARARPSQAATRI